MKRIAARVFPLILIATSCDDRQGGSPVPDASVDNSAARRAEMPLLRPEIGDEWEYEVLLEIPAGVTSRAAAAVSTEFSRKRRYIGKQRAAEGLPEADCFEVEVPGAPLEREFVEIHDDRILLRGSLVMNAGEARPLWFEKPVPFVEAGMRPGTEAPVVSAGEGALVRRLRVIAREEVVVPAGKFRAIRLLMTGSDGEFELRRTIWFAPGTGIVREQKSRYQADRLLFREEQRLARTTMQP